MRALSAVLSASFTTSIEHRNRAPIDYRLANYDQNPAETPLEAGEDLLAEFV